MLAGSQFDPGATLRDFLLMYRDILMSSAQINLFERRNRLLLSELNRNEQPVIVMMKVQTLTATHLWFDVSMSKGDTYL